MSDGDSYKEVSYESWFSRIGKSIGGVVVGVILFLVSILLFWVNEGWAVQAAEGLKEGKAVVVLIKADKVDPANEEKLVHLTGKTETDATPTDPKYKIAAPHAIQLERHVEIYQWQEEKHTSSKSVPGGGKKNTTTYTYNKIWATSPIDSSTFSKSDEYRNKGKLPAKYENWQAGKVTLGAFTVPLGLAGKMDSKKLELTKDLTAKLPEDLKDEYTVKEDYLYKSVSGSDKEPAIGDVRIWYTVIPTGEVSVIAQQSGDTLRPYHTKAKTELYRLSMGNKSAETMLEEAQSESTTLTWVLRLVGWILMGVGIFLLLRPLVVLSDFLPFMGELTGAISFVVAALVSLMLSLLIIAVSWISHRPFLAIGLLVGAAVVAGGAFFLIRSRPRPALKKG
jgi:hypothetical protein